MRSARCAASTTRQNQAWRSSPRAQIGPSTAAGGHAVRLPPRWWTSSVVRSIRGSRTRTARYRPFSWTFGGRVGERMIQAEISLKPEDDKSRSNLLRYRGVPSTVTTPRSPRAESKSRGRRLTARACRHPTRATFETIPTDTRHDAVPLLASATPRADAKVPDTPRNRVLCDSSRRYWSPASEADLTVLDVHAAGDVGERADVELVLTASRPKTEPRPRRPTAGRFKPPGEPGVVALRAMTEACRAVGVVRPSGDEGADRQVRHAGAVTPLRASVIAVTDSTAAERVRAGDRPARWRPTRRSASSASASAPGRSPPDPARWRRRSARRA